MTFTTLVSHHQLGGLFGLFHLLFFSYLCPQHIRQPSLLVMPQAAESVVSKYPDRETHWMKLALRKEMSKGSKVYLCRTKKHNANPGAMERVHWVKGPAAR